LGITFPIAGQGFKRRDEAMQAQANLANAQAALLRQQQIAAEQQTDAGRRAAAEVPTPVGNTNSIATVRLDGLIAGRGHS
jgi:type II secretory pathway pseudopilin PulG